MQVQLAASFTSLHTALMPHGDGLHGSTTSGRGVVVVGLLHRLNGSPINP